MRLASVFPAMVMMIMTLSGNTPAAPSDAAQSTEARVADARARIGDHYADLLQRFIEEIPSIEPGGTVFIGDSITEGFPLAEAFPGQNVINRGIGGDRIAGVTERVDVCIGALAPSRIYLKIGINNLWWGDQLPTEELARLYGELLDAVIAAAPSAEIVVLSTLPCAGEAASLNPRVNELNVAIQALVAERGLTYLNLHPFLADETGALRSEFTGDGVHLTPAGYDAWLQAILPTEEYLEAAINLSSRLRQYHGPTHHVDAIDPPREGEYGGSRGPDQLIVYTPAYGHATTGTNEWGFEAIVVDGRVAETNRGDSAIPENGCVVSGHGRAHGWISSNLTPGALVTLEGNTIRFEPDPEESLTSQQRAERVFSAVLSAIADRREAGEDFDDLRPLLAAAHALRGSDAVAEEAIGRVLEDLDAAVNR